MQKGRTDNVRADCLWSANLRCQTTASNNPAIIGQTTPWKCRDAFSRLVTHSYRLITHTSIKPIKSRAHQHEGPIQGHFNN